MYDIQLTRRGQQTDAFNLLNKNNWTLNYLLSALDEYDF